MCDHFPRGVEQIIRRRIEQEVKVHRVSTGRWCSEDSPLNCRSSDGKRIFRVMDWFIFSRCLSVCSYIKVAVQKCAPGNIFVTWGEIKPSRKASLLSIGRRCKNYSSNQEANHDKLLDIPEELMDNHDLTVDYILTPTQVIRTECKRSKPQGIIWSKVDSEMMERMPILKSLRYREKKAGKDVTLRDERPAEKKELQGLSHFRKPPWKGGSATQMRTNPTEMTKSSDASEEEIEPGSKMQLNASVRMTTVYMGNIPHSLRVSELKNILRDHNALPLRLNWQGAQHRAFLDYKDEVTAEEAVTSLAGLSISGGVIRVELAKSQRGNRSRSQTTENTSNQPLV
ncbi:methenyltetrahydrofolate synthase domain-containing protein isoform X5 [Scyliorhinus torazame]|uniref:methenyltetrahydrofolate synthase domain-containing protein isoform X5 n=1 Tax=Scyliorhinus torazame TaxID=75743 RepID=UPI003B59A78E